MNINITGSIYYDSWGYDMTHNDYILVISETPKSAIVQIIGGEKLSGGGYTGEEIPNKEKKYGTPFRLLKRVYNDEIILKGSYPFCLGDMNAKKKGSFRKWNGRPNYYNTID